MKFLLSASLIMILVAVVSAGAVSDEWADSPSEVTSPPVPFEELTMILETNMTDGDAEIVLFVDHGDGIERVRVKNSCGQKVGELKSFGGLKTLGIGKFKLESAEPSVAGVLAAFPPGVYEVDGKLIDGRNVEGSITLSHALLSPPQFSPAGGAIVNPSSLVVTWPAVPGAAGYLLEIEQEFLGFKMEVALPGNVISFPIAAGLLAGGLEYSIGMGTYTSTGNLSVAESTFFTGSP